MDQHVEKVSSLSSFEREDQSRRSLRSDRHLGGAVDMAAVDPDYLFQRQFQLQSSVTLGM